MASEQTSVPSIRIDQIYEQIVKARAEAKAGVPWWTNIFRHVLEEHKTNKKGDTEYVPFQYQYAIGKWGPLPYSAHRERMCADLLYVAKAGGPKQAWDPKPEIQIAKWPGMTQTALAAKTPDEKTQSKYYYVMEAIDEFRLAEKKSWLESGRVIREDDEPKPGVTPILRIKNSTFNPLVTKTYSLKSSKTERRGKPVPNPYARAKFRAFSAGNEEEQKRAAAGEINAKFHKLGSKMTKTATGEMTLPEFTDETGAHIGYGNCNKYLNFKTMISFTGIISDTSFSGSGISLGNTVGAVVFCDAPYQRAQVSTDVSSLVSSLADLVITPGAASSSSAASSGAASAATPAPKAEALPDVSAKTVTALVDGMDENPEAE